MNNKDKSYIISLGGSLIFPPEGIDHQYLKEFNQFVRGRSNDDYQFYIVCGGGNICRQYQKAVKEIIPSHARTENLDWIGIYVTRVNALLLQTILKDIAYPEILTDYDEFDQKMLTFPVIIGAGWKPGFSTDHDAVLLAEDCEAKTIINLSNIDIVYDADPRKNLQASPIKHMSWNQLLQITGTEWSAGLNAPFDPIAAQKAKELGLKVIICHGHDLDNLGRILEGKDFVGTTIE